MTTKKKTVKVVERTVEKLPDWLTGVELVGETLVIPTDRFNVRKVTSQDAIDHSTVSVKFEVSRKPPLCFAVASGSIFPQEDFARKVANIIPCTYARPLSDQ